MAEITVGDLIEQLKIFNQDVPVCFGPSGHFSFYRTKNRGGEVQIEFNESLGTEYELLEGHPKFGEPY